MNADSPNGVRELAGPAASEHEELIETFLASIHGASLREAAGKTGVDDAVIGKMRNGQRVVRKQTEDKIKTYLKARGLWPKPPSADELRAARGGRAEVAFRHFTSPALMKHFGWNASQVVAALFLYADEQQFGPSERADLGNLTNTFLSGANKEGL